MSCFKAKMHQIRFQRGLLLVPAGGPYTAPPGSLAEFKEPTSKGKRMGTKGNRKERGMGSKGNEVTEGRGGRKKRGGKKAGGKGFRHGCWGMDTTEHKYSQNLFWMSDMCE